MSKLEHFQIHVGKPGVSRKKINGTDASLSPFSIDMNNDIAPRKSRFKASLAVLGFTLWCVSLFTSPVLTSHALAQDNAPNHSQPILICTNQTNAIHMIAADFIVAAYMRIGRDVEFVNLPNRRSLMQADDGACDGETIRIEGLDKTYKNLIRVPVPVAQLHGVAFMKHHSDTHLPDFNTWQDMRGLDVYIIRGEIYAERGTADIGGRAVGTYKQLFTMLEQDRADVGIGIHHVGLVELARNFPNSTIHTHGAPLLNTSLYHYIHRKNQHLLSDLTRVLQDMATSGELEIINAKALSRLMVPPPEQK